MADDKKKPKEVTLRSPTNELIFLLAGLLLLGVIMERIVSYLSGFGLYSVEGVWATLLVSFDPLWPVLKFVAIILSTACIVWAIYSFSKLKKIKEEEKKFFGATAITPTLEKVEENKQTEKWQRVVDQSNSPIPSDWRLAIIEADVMLEELLRSNGYPGDSLGEMLKSAKPGDFLTLEAAWDAHKTRNNIAHSGTDFQLNERETRRTIALFESVFKEFGVI